MINILILISGGLVQQRHGRTTIKSTITYWRAYPLNAKND